MFKTILVPLDRSSLAEQALGPATAIAQASGGEIELVLAHLTVPHGAGAFDAKDPAELIYLRRTADEIARRTGVVVGSTVVAGTPVDAIGRRAHEVDADLIVMTSHGRTGLSRAWLGSVTDGVVRNASVPVLMLRASDARPQTSRAPAMPLFRRILVPLDGSVTSSSIVSTAAAMARCNGAQLVLLRVVAPVPVYIMDPQVPAYPTTVIDPVATKQAADDAQQELTELATSVEHEYSLKAETVVEVSPAAAQAILDTARQRDVGLIAMTTHGRGASRLIVGSVTDKVLRGSHVPMLLHRPGRVKAAANPAALAAGGAIRRMAGLTEDDLTP